MIVTPRYRIPGGKGRVRVCSRGCIAVSGLNGLEAGTIEVTFDEIVELFTSTKVLQQLSILAVCGPGVV